MSDLWIRKIRTYFLRCDFDKDGVIHRKDFMDMTERLGDLEKSDPKQMEISRQRFDDLFTRYAKASGTTDLLTEDVMIESIKMQRDDPEMKNSISDVTHSLFTAVDINNDGHLDFEEFSRIYDDIGMGDSGFTKAAFDKIDANHDEVIQLIRLILKSNVEILEMSDIWIRKMRTVFRRFDFDNDGLVHRQDFVHMAERLGDLEKSNQKQKEISRQRFDELFTRYAKTSGTTDVLTEGVLINSMKMQRDDPQMKKCISDAMSSLFTAMDVNNDGHLDFEEFRRALDDVGVVDSSFARAAFDEIDVNHDGKLSFEEYIKAVIDYMCSDDENTTAALGLLF